jgi:putative flippase GtrA
MMRRPTIFIIVGAAGYAVQMALLWLLVTIAGWPNGAATAAAVEAAVMFNFVWHERWTWKDRRGPRYRRLLQFHAANGIVSLVGNVVVTVALARLGVPVLLANSAAVGLLAIANYAAADRWVFAPRKDEARSRRPDRQRAGPPDRLSDGSGESAEAQAARVEGAAPAKRDLATRRVAGDIAAAGAMILVAAVASEAAGPQARTVDAWQQHIAGVERTLWRDRADWPATPSGRSFEVPDGTIYEWRGSVLLPHVTVAEVVEALTNPGTPPPQEDVVASRVLRRNGSSLHVYLRLVRHALITVTYDTEHDVDFTTHNSSLATSRSVSTRIAESDGGDRGFLWRLNSYWRYRQVGQDVQVDVLSVSLSRGIPLLVKPVAGRMAHRIARESLVRTLDAMRRFMTRDST